MATRRRPSRRAPRRASEPPSRLPDAIGLVLFFAGASALLWLAWPQHAPVPATVLELLGTLAGSASWAVASGAIAVGSLLLVGYRGKRLLHPVAGIALLTIAAAAWHDLAGEAAESLTSPGGWLGATLVSALVRWCGVLTTHLALALIACAGAVLLADRPLPALIAVRTDRQALREGAPTTSRARRRVEAVVRAREPSTTRGGGRASVQPPSDAAAPLTDVASPPAPLRRRVAPPPDVDIPDDGEVPVIETEAPRRRRSPKTEHPDQPPLPALAAEARAEDGAFQLPPVELLSEPRPVSGRGAEQEMARKIEILERTLEEFGIEANVVEIARGPTVTRYEVRLAPGIKVSKIVSLADNLAMALAAIDVRLEAPIPGKSAIGVEVPNTAAATVTLRECLDSPEFWNAPGKLTVVLGKDVSGRNRYADLARMPHLLIGGSTNSGKSVCLNAIIASITYRATPAEVKFLLIDPKRVELALWDGIPHMMCPVVKDIRQAAGIFRAAIKEMDRRYDLFSRMGTRNIDGYNARVPVEDRLPYVVIVVDELADLMMQAGAEVEGSICRLAQLARATGIHMVIATQRPSVDVITGLIKANIPSRIAFAVSSQVDSRTILDSGGAERLIGRGDMLYKPIDAPKPVRVQGCYLSEGETNALVTHLKEQERPEYTLTPVDLSSFEGGVSAVPDGGADDELWENAVRLVVSNGHASTSMLQRRFKIGYTRAARLLDRMEDRGIVGPLDGAKPRELLVTRDEVERMFAAGED